MNIYGTGGIGKSFLLEEFRRRAEQAGVPFLNMDLPAGHRTPSGFLRHLLKRLRGPSPSWDLRKQDVAKLQQQGMEALEQWTTKGKILLAIDSFEEFSILENWLREEFLAHLHPHVVILIAGRFPLQGPWLSSPAWRQLILRMPLADLDVAAVQLYLARAGLERQEAAASVWNKTKGHPLTLSLYAATSLTHSSVSVAKVSEDEIFPYVVHVWLKEVPDPELRHLVEAAAVLRHFNQELISYVVDHSVSSHHFMQLTHYSFVRRTERGWIVHDMLRHAIEHELRLRAPAYYDSLSKRSVQYFYCQLRQSINSRSIAEAGLADWVYYVGNSFIRMLFFRHQDMSRVESLNRSNWAEAQQYLDCRMNTPRDVWIEHVDPITSGRYEYQIGAKEIPACFSHATLQELYDLDPSAVKLIRDARDQLCGIACLIPIHEGTLHYLSAHPPSTTYFSSLSSARLKELMTPQSDPAGYFIQYIDVLDYSDDTMRQAAGQLFFSHMLAARLVVTTAPSNTFFQAIFQNLGFEKVKEIVHYDYDSRQPTPYYVLDMRGNKLHDYLDRMIATVGLTPDRPAGVNEGLAVLSKRESGVMEMLLQGATNAEIAEAFYLSEATVKKHVSNIFSKLRVKNRVQLIRQWKGDTFNADLLPD